MYRSKPLAALAATTILCGCSLAPDFTLPDISVPALFKEAPKPAAADAQDTNAEAGSWKVGEPAEAQTGGQWWLAFGDEKLNALQAQALAGNQDVKAMVARVQQARAFVGVVTSGMFPTVTANGGLNRYKPGAVIPGFASGGDLKPITQYSGNVGLSYEIDLFGRALESRRIAVANAESSEALLSSVTLAMQADVAQTYFALRAADAERALLKETLGLREEGLGLLRKRLKAGTTDELDIKREEVEVEQTRTQLLALDQQRKELEHALAVLTGKAPADFGFEEATFAYTVPTIPEGLPSSLLERRPDVIAAQRALAAANGEIGLARAAFFPKISLTASGGYESSAFEDLFKWSSRTWALGPMLSLPIFEGGRRIYELDQTNAAYDEAVANYRQSVLKAFRDVEDSLSRLGTLRQQGMSQDVSAASATRASSLLKSRYDVGDVSYLEWADGRRNELASKRLQIQIQRDRINATVQLIRALGGGWDKPAAKP